MQWLLSIDAYERDVVVVFKMGAYIRGALIYVSSKVVFNSTCLNVLSTEI